MHGSAENELEEMRIRTHLIPTLYAGKSTQIPTFFRLYYLVFSMQEYSLSRFIVRIQDVSIDFLDELVHMRQLPRKGAIGKMHLSFTPLVLGSPSLNFVLFNPAYFSRRQEQASRNALTIVSSLL